MFRAIHHVTNGARRIFLPPIHTQIAHKASFSTHVQQSIQSASTVEPSCFVSALDSPIKGCDVKAAQIKDGNIVQVTFSDGSAFDFHGLWLRDACRDPKLVSLQAGERYLDRIPTTTGCPGTATSADVANGDLEVAFDADHSEVAGFALRFPSGFLRMYGPVAGRPVNSESTVHSSSEAWRWLEAYSGYENAPAPDLRLKKLWKNEGNDPVQYYDVNAVCSSDAHNLDMLQALMEHGVVILKDVPKAYDGKIVRDFADKCLGGMQKDPARDDANWVIKRKDDAVSVSYAQTARLNNHTDQSVPAHGIPALLLAVHYVSGSGVNTLVDTYAVVEAMRERDPAALHMLSTYGNCQERDFVRSRVDSVQKGTQGMLIATKKPIIQLDAKGNMVRAQYNEVFRTPSTVPFDKFPEYYRAYCVWNDMIHSTEFEVEVPISAGHILVIDNWRVLHGRAGGRSSTDRIVMGGTVVREGFHSKAIQLMGSNPPVPDYSVE